MDKDVFTEMYEKTMSIVNELTRLGLTKSEIDSLMEEQSIENVSEMLETAKSDGIDDVTLKAMLISNKEDNKLSIEDIVESNPLKVEANNSTLYGLLENSDVYAPSIDPVKENVDYTDVVKNNNVESSIEQLKLLDKFNREKSTKSLTDFVYSSIKPENISRINLKDESEKASENAVNHNVSSNWVEKGEYISVDDLKNSLLKFYDDHKNDKYKIMMPDGKEVQYKISKHNIKQLSKRLAETTQILLDERKQELPVGKPDDRSAAINHLDKNDTGAMKIHIGNVNIDNYRNLTAGRYVPEEDAKESLVGMFRRTTPWGIIKSALTDIGKERTMIDEAIEGSRGK